MELDRGCGGRQLRLEVERLQHGDRDVLGGRDRRGLPAAARLDRVQARGGELDAIERAALGQEHRGVVGPGVEVDETRVDPAHDRPRGHGERAQHLVRARPRELGLGRGGAGDVEAEAVVALACDAHGVDRLADAARRPDPASAVLRRRSRRAARARTGRQATSGCRGPTASRRPGSRCR